MRQPGARAARRGRPRHEDPTRIVQRLDETGLEVEIEELIRHHYVRSFDHIGTEEVSGGDDEEAVYEV